MKKSFNYMLSQNQGNPSAIEKGLSALSLHPFGNHAECSGEWCLHREDPYGKPLTNTELQEDIPQIFARPKKHSDKLSQLGSTQSMKVLIGLWLPKDLMHIFTADPLGKGLLLA